MTTEERRCLAIERQNRLLKAACLLVTLVATVALVLGAAPRVDPNKVGTAQQVVGVDSPDGFAVVVDEHGKINVVNNRGQVIVNRSKTYSK